MNAAGGHGPARKWFNESHSRLSAVVAQAEKHPVIVRVLESNFGK